tara:strand:+ start:439 stop:825 length:387 start_codon:yes stop_codon:yes gene_type:complete
MSVEQLQTKLNFTLKRVKFAWAKYYSQVNEALHNDHQQHTVLARVADDKEIPKHIKEEMKAMAVALKKKWECPVCIDMISDGELEITNCGHYYCKPCLEQWKKTCKDRGDAKWKCSVCNRNHKFNDSE